MELKNPFAGGRDAELDVLSKSVNPVRLKNNPVGIDENQSKKAYEKIIEERVK